VWSIHDSQTADIDPCGLGNGLDLGRWTHEDGLYQVFFSGLNGPEQRRLLARMGYRGGNGLEASALQ
jgi:hypothetical protein